MITLCGNEQLGSLLAKREEPLPHQQVALRLRILQQRKLQSEREQPQKNEAPELKLSVEECGRQIRECEAKLEELHREKHELFLKLKRVLHMEDERRRNAQKKISREREREAKPLATPMEHTVVDLTGDCGSRSPDHLSESHLRPSSTSHMYLEHVGSKRARSPSPVQLYPLAPTPKRTREPSLSHSYPPSHSHALSQPQVQEQTLYTGNPHRAQLVEANARMIPAQQHEARLIAQQEAVHLGAPPPPSQQAVPQQQMVMVRHGATVYEAAPGQTVINSPLVIMQQPGQPHPEEMAMLQYGGSGNVMAMIPAGQVSYAEQRVPHAEFHHEPPPETAQPMITGPSGNRSRVLSPPHRHHQGGLLPLPGTEETYEYGERYVELDCERDDYYHEHMEELPPLQHRLTQMAKPAYNRPRPLLGPNFQGRRGGGFAPRDIAHRGGVGGRFSRMRGRGYRGRMSNSVYF